jgi:hypothetical protein
MRQLLAFLILSSSLFLSSCSKNAPEACIEGLDTLKQHLIYTQKLSAACSKNAGSITWNKDGKFFSNGVTISIENYLKNLNSTETFELTVEGIDGKRTSKLQVTLDPEFKKIELFSAFFNAVFSSDYNSYSFPFQNSTVDHVRVFKGETGSTYPYYFEVEENPLYKLGFTCSMIYNFNNGYNDVGFYQNLTIPSQQINGYTFSGTGKLTYIINTQESQLNINLNYTQGIGGDPNNSSFNGSSN